MTDVFKEIERERDPEVLKLFSRWLAKDNIRLKKELSRVKSEQAKESQMLVSINDQLNALRKVLFGRKSEKRKSDSSRPRDKEADEFLLHAQSLVPAPENEDVEALETEVKYYEMSNEELMVESSSRGYENAKPTDWEEIRGLYEESTEVTVLERKYKKTIHRRKKYRFKPSQKNKDEKQIIVTAEGAEKLFPGCGYSIDFALSIVGDKYMFHLPLERQKRKMESLGLNNVAIKTLWGLAAGVAIHHEKIAEGIKTDIMDSEIALHADETPWPINSKKDDDGYMWCVSNQAGAFYRFEPTRSGRVIEEILEDYSGPVLTDGFSGYNRLKNIKGITLANCWAHARRKFYEIKENYPEDCEEMLDYMDKLYKIERKARTFEELELLRKEESRPVIDKILEWLMEKKSKHLPESGFTKAVNYSLKYWSGLTLFLKDVRVPLTNNDVERAIRHSVMGRKNFYGSKSINGADVAATLYTVIESCKRVELDPIAYMKYVILSNVRKEKPLTPLNFAKYIRSN